MPAPSTPHDHPSSPFQLSSHPGHLDHTRVFDYLQKYPVDKKGKELEPDSRTWKVYIDEHESYDYDMVNGFRDNIDALLVFAALFSSVVTGFVVPAAERLEPDNTQISTSILFEATLLLRANGNVTMIAATPQSELRPGSVTHTSEDVWVACLFFSSLSLSLATAFVSILAKQWLQALSTLVPGDAKQRSLTRQFRFGGMKKWKFSEIVGILPLLLHLSLALFLAGLCVYVNRYHKSILALIGSIAGATVVFYVVTSALPAVHLDCPYRIPILFIPASTCVFIWKMVRFIVNQLWVSLKSIVRSFLASRKEPLAYDHVPRPSFTSKTLSFQEREYVMQNTPRLELSSLEWLYTQTTNTSVQKVALYALARAFSKYVCSPTTEDLILLPPIAESLPLGDMRSFALTFIDCVSGSETIEDLPQLLDFYLHSSHILQYEVVLPETRWPSLIQSPLLQSFLDRGLLPLDVTFTMNDCGGHPLHMACYFGRWDIVPWLLHHCPASHLSMGDSAGWLPLGRAALSTTISNRQWQSIVKTMMMRSTVDVGRHPVNSHGDTALHVLCENGAELAKIRSVASIWWGLWNVQRKDGQTPLHSFCMEGRNLPQSLEIADYLLSEGADVAKGDENQYTPLHLASSTKCSADLVQILCSHLQTIKHGQHIINKSAKDGNTALHLASSPFRRHSSECSRIVQILISAGADPNIVNPKNQNLPLHLACSGRRLFSLSMEVIGTLLNNTQDVNARNYKGSTPLDFLVQNKATSKKWQMIYDLMREKGARVASELESELELAEQCTE